MFLTNHCLTKSVSEIFFLLLNKTNLVLNTSRGNFKKPFIYIVTTSVCVCSFSLDLSSPPAVPECPVVLCLISCRQYKIDLRNGCLLCICEANYPPCSACDCPINIAEPIDRDDVTGCPKCGCNSRARPPLPALVPLPSPTPLPAPTPHPPLQPHPPPPTSCEVSEHFHQLFSVFCISFVS